MSHSKGLPENDGKVNLGNLLVTTAEIDYDLP